MNVMSVLNQVMQQAQGSQSKAAGGGSGIDVKSLLGGGALGLMIGSKRGRKIGGAALKYGAIAGVGALAYRAYQNYQTGNQAQHPTSPAQLNHHGQPLESLRGQDQERRGLEILQALIMAARADGHIDENERRLLTQEIEKLNPDGELHAWIQQQFEAPLDAKALARSADSRQAGHEIYAVSAAIIDEQNPMERAWLDQLASALALPPDLARELEQQVQHAAH